MHTFINLEYDSLGNIAGISGVWEVPDDFDPDVEYLLFATEFKIKHPTKTGCLTQRHRKTQARQWIKWMGARFAKVSYIHHD